MTEAKGHSTKRFFTEKEDEFIKENYHAMGGRAIAKLLDRSKNAVVGRAYRLGICKSLDEILHLRRFRAKQEAQRPAPPRDFLMVERPVGFANRQSRVRLLPQKLPDETVSPLNGVGVKIWELDYTHCRWVMGESKEMTFCGHQKRTGSHYCETHYQKSVVKK